MKIKGTISKTQVATSDQLDNLARIYGGVRLTIDDSGETMADIDTTELSMRNVSVDGCYADAKESVEEKFSTTVTNTGERYQRILDPEVLSVLKTNMGDDAVSDGKLLADNFEALTSVSTWFKDNVNAIVFDEFNLTSVTSLSGSAMNKIQCIGGKEGVIYLKNVKTLGLASVIASKALFMPKFVHGDGFAWSYALSGCKIADLGDNVSYLTSGNLYQGTEPTYYIIRNTEPFQICSTQTKVSSNSIFFLPADSFDAYYEYTGWADYTKKYAIGGDEWQTAMQALGEEEGYTLQDGESWADEYIDYKIYGVEPPTE